MNFLLHWTYFHLTSNRKNTASTRCPDLWLHHKNLEYAPNANILVTAITILQIFRKPPIFYIHHLDDRLTNKNKFTCVIWAFFYYFISCPDQPYFKVLIALPHQIFFLLCFFELLLGVPPSYQPQLDLFFLFAGLNPYLWKIRCPSDFSFLPPWLWKPCHPHSPGWYVDQI